jgi:multidrug efflux pump
VVLEVAPQYWQARGAEDIYLHSRRRRQHSAESVAVQPPPRRWRSTTPACFPSVTVSFNLAPNVSLSEATQSIQQMQAARHALHDSRGFFAGTLQAYQQSLGTEPILILTALLAVYIVLGILYESLVHPLTIISTLPSASVGAMLALMLFGRI